MIFFVLTVIFVIGLFFGSFLNVIVDRQQRKETVLTGRSYCEFCKKELKWYDLIPIFSFLFLRGKCRYCHKKLSLYYPLTELSTAVLFTITYAFLNFQPVFNSLIANPLPLIYYLFLSSSFIVIVFSDLKYNIIPDKIVIPAIIISFLYLLIVNPPLLVSYLLSALGSFAFFLMLFLITKGKGMGFGDVKLSFLLGLVLGFPKIILALYLAFLTGAAIGIILILWKKKRTIKDTIPFGPFLILGTLVSLFLGELIIPKITTFLGLL